MISRFALGLLVALSMAGTSVFASDLATPVHERFTDAQALPSYQKHVLPLMSKVGCSGRACHGSFQGQGGFRLSLFGYDFEADHKSLLGGDEPRVDLKSAADSLMLRKPTKSMPHKGGKRMEPGGWEYRLLSRWIEAGARGEKKSDTVHFTRLDLEPA